MKPFLALLTALLFTLCARAEATQNPNYCHDASKTQPRVGKQLHRLSTD
jgi:hypothetical protein